MGDVRPRSNSQASNPSMKDGGRERAGSIASMLSGPGGKILNEKINIINEGRGFATFEIKDEDHTLGNVLRTAAMNDRKVRTAAYIVPHPLESRMEIRMETEQGETPSNALKSALDRVVVSCDEFSDKFEAGLTAFKAQRSADRMEIENS